MPKTPSKSKKSVDSAFTVTLKCLDRVYTTTGATVEEAVGAIKMSGGTRALSVLRIEKDGKSREKILNGLQTHSLFGPGSPTSKMIAFKRIKQIFDLQ